jgi:hypothetical protein
MEPRGETKATLWTRFIRAISLGAILVLFVVFAVLLRSASSALGLVAPPASSTPLPTDPFWADLPPEGQTIEAMLKATRFSVTVLPNAWTPSYNPPTPAPYTPGPWDWGSGFYGGEAPFPAQAYKMVSTWYGMVNNFRVTVYAGGLRDDPGVSQSASQGFLLVVAASPEGEYHPESYLSPVKAGPLKIVSVENLRLVINTPDGYVFYFDLPSRQFIDSLDAAPLPTVTSPATLTPEPLLPAYP